MTHNCNIYSILVAGGVVNTDATKRFIRNALWEAEKEKKTEKKGEEEEEGEGAWEGSSSGKEGKADNPDTGESTSVGGGDGGGDGDGDGGGATEETDSSYTGGKKRKLDMEDTPSSDSTKRTRLE